METERDLLLHEQEELMFRWHRSSLKAKLLLCIVLLFVLVLGSVSFIENYIAVRIVERQLLGAAHECAAGVAAELRQGLPDTQGLLSMLALYQQEMTRELYDIAVLQVAEDGSLSTIAALRGETDYGEEHALALRTAEPTDRIVKIADQRYWSTVRPVPIPGHQGQTLVGVWMSLHSVDVLRQRYATLLMVTVPLSIALFALLIHLIFGRLLHHPLRSLGAAMVRVESGDLSVEAPVARKDEIGIISERFNRMVERLKKAVDEKEALVERVDGFNKELQQKVSESTLELEERNRQLRKVNAELYYMQRRLARSERLSVAGQMTATFAHKLGTPLNLISGYVQTLLQGTPDRKTLQEKLRLIYAQVERLTGIMRNLLDETRSPVLDLKPIRLDELLERILAAVEPMLHSHGVRVDATLERDLPPVMADESQLEQVFLNLVNNSLDAMPHGGTLTVETEIREDMFAVRFSDTGEGIPETELGHIFRPLFTTKEIGKGTGLGLAIVKEVLTAHGASISVESEVAKGTSFVLEFPLVTNAQSVSAPS